MPLVTSNFSDVAERVSKKYWFDHTQSSLKVTNSGSFPVIVEVSDEVGLILAGQSHTFTEEFKQFSIRCKTKGGDSSAFSVELDSYRAAITNLGGGTGGVDLSEIETRLSNLENPISISAFTITNPTAALEVGATLASLGISWTILNATSGIVRDITNAVNIHTVNTASGTATITGLSITKNTPSSNSFQLQVGSVNSTTRTVNWQWAMYYGNSANTTLTEAQAKALTKQLRSSAVGNYVIAAASGYKHILIPKSMTQPSGFKDTSTGFAVAMRAPVEVAITNDQGVSVVMYDYCTSNSFDDAITIEAV